MVWSWSGHLRFNFWTPSYIVRLKLNISNNALIDHTEYYPKKFNANLGQIRTSPRSRNYFFIFARSTCTVWWSVHDTHKTTKIAESTLVYKM